MKNHNLIFTAISLLAVCGCTGMRMQTQAEAANEVSKSSQAKADRQCDRYQGQQQLDCRRQVREEYEALRAKNLQ